jgi:hypothetical protein
MAFHAKDTTGHWPQIASQWKHVGTPLRPGGEDLAFLRERVLSQIKSNPVRAVILGVTPEFFFLPWPTGSDVKALDKSVEMIAAVWPGPKESAICANWLTLPGALRPRHLVLCDGGLSVLKYPEELAKLISALKEITNGGSLCAFRLYVPPIVRESPEAVLADLRAGTIPDLNHLKLRLWMALEDSGAGVQLAHIWETIHQIVPDLSFLASKIGWSADQVRPLDTYQNCQDRYFFPSIAQVVELFCTNPGGFELAEVFRPNYPLGECRPTIVFQRH